MRTMASRIPSVSIVYSIVCSDDDQRKHRSSASLACVRRIHRWPVNSPHIGTVTRNMFPFADVFMCQQLLVTWKALYVQLTLLAIYDASDYLQLIISIEKGSKIWLNSKPSAEKLELIYNQHDLKINISIPFLWNVLHIEYKQVLDGCEINRFSAPIGLNTKSQHHQSHSLLSVYIPLITSASSRLVPCDDLWCCEPLVVKKRLNWIWRYVLQNKSKFLCTANANYFVILPHCPYHQGRVFYCGTLGKNYPRHVIKCVYIM